MFNRVTILGLCMVVIATVAHAQEVMTNATITRLHELGLGSEVLLSKVRKTASSFDVSVDGLAALRERGVPDEVITAMIEADSGAEDGGAALGHPSTSRALYPLMEGLTWEYQVSAGSMLGSGGGQRAIVTNLPQRQLRGSKVIPQRVDIGQQSHFAFVANDETGIYEYARQAAGAVEPEVLPTPSYSLKYPLRTGATWGGTTETSLLTNRVSLSTQTTVEAMDAAVTVSAGTFSNCLKTKTVGQTTQDLGPIMGRAKIRIEDHAWFCPGVGMVKAVRKETSNHLMMGSGQVSMELAAFKE